MPLVVPFCAFPPKANKKMMASSLPEAEAKKPRKEKSQHTVRRLSSYGIQSLHSKAAMGNSVLATGTTRVYYLIRRHPLIG